MATHIDTTKLIPYQGGGFPNLGNPERFIAGELAKISTSINKIIEVMKLMETRMNNAGLA